ncbi:MAG TPA: hypothetical protein PLS00_07240, partial [Niabella sp.]|nr:hypothetical protein [Niabella sp.]
IFVKLFIKKKFENKHTFFHSYFLPPQPAGCVAAPVLILLLLAFSEIPLTRYRTKIGTSCSHC